MPQTGHPDWLRIPVGINNVFVNKNLTLNTSGTILGTFYVNDYPHLAITFENFDTTAYNWIELRWDTVNSPLLWSSRDTIAIGPTNTYTGTVPTKGSWVQIVAFSDVAPTGITNLLVYGTTSSITPDASRERGDTLISDSSAYTSSQSKTFDATATYGGPAIFSFDAVSSAPASVDIKFWSTSAKLHVIYMHMGIQSTNTSLPAILYVPPAHLRLVVFNGSTAQTLRVLVTPAPLFGS